MKSVEFHLNNQPYKILDGGRVKAAGGSVKPYYDCAQPIINRGVDGAKEAAEKFLDLKKKPPFSLLLAFFPDDSRRIKRRLRGAGLYRNLKMDQGPGGNFMTFGLGEDGRVDNYEIIKEKGYVVREAVIERQLQSLAPTHAIFPLIEDLETSFRENRYRETASLVGSFKNLAKSSGLEFPDGSQVGSRSGFFFIRPAETDREVRVGLNLASEVAMEVAEVSLPVFSMAQYARELMLSGLSYEKAVNLAGEYHERFGEKEYDGNGLLYFQPDVLVTNKGDVMVERVNMPDVGLFLTELNARDNSIFDGVRKTNESLRRQLVPALCEKIAGSRAVIITRDEVVERMEDTLEVLEIKSLRKSLSEAGIENKVIKLSEYQRLENDDAAILLNVESSSTEYPSFVEKVVDEGLECFPDPLLRTFEDRATSFEQIRVEGDYLERILEIVKPKRNKFKDPEKLQEELFLYLQRGGAEEDILYVRIPGVSSILPVFRYSLHSFSQIYNEIEKSKRLGNSVDSITIIPVPFKPEEALFEDNEGARLAAFRFFCVQL